MRKRVSCLRTQQGTSRYDFQVLNFFCNLRIQSLYVHISYIVRVSSNYKYSIGNLLLALRISRISPCTLLVGMVTELCATWSGIWICFYKSSRQSLGPTQLHIQWVPAYFTRGQAESWSVTSVLCWSSEWVELYLYSLIMCSCWAQGQV